MIKGVEKFFLSIKYRGYWFTSAIFIIFISRRFLYSLFPLSLYLKLMALLKIGYIPNLKTPTSFNEKVLNKKLSKDISSLAPYADKYSVRVILLNKGFGQILNKLICYYDINNSFPTIKDLPQKFVMKANHGSGMIKIVKNSKRIDVNELHTLADIWLNTNYNKAVGGTEYHYDSIAPKIIFEEFLENDDGAPLLDYKFYCFNGKVEFIDIVDNSKGIPLMYIFDRNWSQLPFALYNKHTKGNFQKPPKLEEMVRLAENLSSEFDFVRMDLYLINNNKIVFGEYTFFPGGGMLKFKPRKFDYIYGEKLNLEFF